MNSYRTLIAFAFMLMLGASTVAQPTGYMFSKSVTVNASRVQGTNTDFPVLVSVTDTDLKNNVENANGYDIIFAENADGTSILNHDLESYSSASGKLVAWVKVPSISSSANKTIYMFYGNSSVSTDLSSTATWDSDYRLVMHMTPDLSDATSYANNGSNNGSSSATGMIGDGRSFNRNNNHHISVAHNSSLNLTNQITMSFWVNLSTTSPLSYLTKGSDESYQAYSRNNGRPEFRRNGNSSSRRLRSNTQISQNSWVYLTYVKSTTAKFIYINGDLDVTGSDTGTFDTNNKALIISRDGNGLDGLMDEVRVSSIPRSADWIKTEYNNQSSPNTFITLGAQVEYTPPLAPQNVGATSLLNGNIQISFDDVNEVGSGVASYSIKRSTTSGGPYTQVGTVVDNESTSYTFTDNSVTVNTNYFYVVTAIDGNSNESDYSSEVSAFSDNMAPPAPTNVSAISIANGSIQVSFDDVNEVGSGVVSYSVRRSTNSGGPYTEVGTVVDDESPNYTFTDNTSVNGTTYYYVVVVIDAVSHESANSSIVSATADGAAPNAPANVSATAVVGNAIDIKFDDVNETGSGVISYSVRRSTSSGGPYSIIGTVPDTESSFYTFADNTAQVGNTYYYVVVAVDAASNESVNSLEVNAESGSVVDITPPTIVSSTVYGNELSLVYNENLKESSIPATSNYVLRVNGTPISITAIQVSGKKVYISFNPSIAPGDNVSLDYTAGANPVQDVYGNNAANFSAYQINNTPAFTTGFGPNPCPIINGHDAAWSCFDGSNNGTSMSAVVGGLEIANITAASGSQTTFSPNALQSWTSGAFAGDEFNGPQANPSGNSGNATSFDINIPAGVPSDAITFSLNRLRPDGGGTSYTLEAFDASNTKIPLNGWLTGQGSDGGSCTNAVNTVYTNGNTTIQFQPTVSGDPACAASSTPVWFRVTDDNVRRIELRKTTSLPDNIYLGVALLADFGDAPNVYGTSYSSRTMPPAFHILNNSGVNPVYFGSGVDADGNGVPNSAASTDTDDGISTFPVLTTATTNYSVTLSCTNGAQVGGWIDFDQSGSFDVREFDSSVCSNGNVTLNWSGLTGMSTGTTYARFRIASNLMDIGNPTGAANDGEVEDYRITISEPITPDLSIVKSVNNSTPIEGETITYTLTVTNPGEYIATDVRVTDVLPTGLTFVSSTASQGHYNSVTGIWLVGNFAAGDTSSATLYINATVDTGTLGSVIDNTASITDLNEIDPVLANNSSTAGITVIPEAADIAVTAIASNSNPIEGEYMSFTVSVTNNGPKDATNLKILNQIPSGILFQNSTASVGTYTSSTGVWDIGNLANGTSASLTLNVQINANTEGNTINNTAALSSMDQADNNTANNTSTAPITVVEAISNLSCGLPYPKFQNPTLFSGNALQVGAVYKFPSVLPGVYATVEVVTMNNVQMIDIDDDYTINLPNDFSPYITNNNSGDGYVDFEISFFDSTTDQSRYLTFAATSSDVDGTGNLKDYVGYQTLQSFVVENSTMLIIGAEALYTTFISSDFTDTRPEYANYTNYKVYTEYTNEPRFRYRAGIKAGSTVGSRIVSLSFDPCEINTFNNPVTQSVNDIAVTKTVNKNSVNVGENVTFTVQASNKRANAAGNIQITDQIPSDLTFVSATPSQGTYNSSSGVWNVGNLTGLQVANLEIVAKPKTGTRGKTITNTATLTGISGIDGVSANNSASVSIAVIDPNSGLSCSEPPLYSFVNYTLEEGATNQINSVYRFTNVASGVDAKLRIVDINNATITALDDDGSVSGGQSTTTNFSPMFKSISGYGASYIDWEITFVEAGTNKPIKSEFSVTGLDIDGTSSSGRTGRDYYGFAQNQSSTTQMGSNVNISTQGPFQIFESAVTTDASDPFDIDHMAYISYKYTSVFQVRSGLFATGGFTNQRMVEFNFTQCLNQNFTNPVTTTRNADLQVTKTVDQPNPLENETVTFTINVKNNGPEEATEVTINETLPSGITLVEATTNYGSYNQLTKLWDVGTLANNATATLTLETTIDSGQSQDSLINKAYIQGFNQHDPNISNDTSSVVLKVSVQATGTVFQDKTGDGITDGDTNFGDASGDQQGVENVKVHLFKDGGDGQADGVDDVYKGTVLTNNLGKYIFQIGENGTYWIAVDSKTGGLSNGTTWAEQTYAPAGALCSDGNGGTSTTSVAGNCFGGREAGVSDNISSTPVNADLANAQHLSKIVINGAGITKRDFGFSFNVVTNTRDGDDDNSSNRSVQGSLRQFITNANSINGANTMRFVPSVPTNETGSGGNWWSITANSELPSIIGALTTIDGTAYSRTSPLTKLDSNPGTIGTGGVVGLDQLALNTMELKELEINLNDVGVNALSVNSTGAVNIREIALYNNSTGINISGVSGGTFENNLIGTRANGTDPNGAARIEKGIVFTGSSSLTALVARSYIANAQNSGIASTNANAAITIFRNEFYKNGLVDVGGDAIEGLGTWNVEQNLIHESGNASSSAIFGGSGIEIGANTGSTSNNSIRNNTIINNRVAGINVLNNVTNSLIEKNKIRGNGTNYSSSSTRLGAGIKLTNPSSQPLSGIKITNNSFANNFGLAIDIVTSGSGEADGVSANDGLLVSATNEPNRGIDYPIFTLSTLNGNVLHLEGYVGKATAKLSGTFNIEVYKANNDGDNNGPIEKNGVESLPHGEGEFLLGVITSNPDGTFSQDITINGTVPLAVNDRITAIAIGSANNTSEFSVNQRVVPTGVTINGTVYNDANFNSTFEGGEAGIPNVTIVLYNVAQNNCKSVLSDANGFYTFGNVLNGQYKVIKAYGETVPTPNVCIPSTVNPPNYVSTDTNVRDVTINNLPSIQNFGNFEGVKVEGRVFNDNGVGGGTPNDAVQNGAELGSSNVTIQAFNASNTLVRQTTTNANGGYVLYLPKSSVPDGSTVKVKQTNLSGTISTGATVGNTSGSYNIATDEITFTSNLGVMYNGLNFGNVEMSTLLNDGQRTIAAGTSTTFNHVFEAKTGGDVTFSVANIFDPNIQWPINIYQDLNCNGEIDSGEPALDGNTPISVIANEQVCIIIKVTAPNGLINGATSTSTLNASFALTNTTPIITQALNKTDLVTVDNTQGGLSITKIVDKNSALPGSILTYTITYTNNGADPISTIKVSDTVPAYTKFTSASFSTPLPNNLTSCTITAPAVGGTGQIKWEFDGSLLPGQTGTATFQVKINQ
ncbi:MAG: DUF2341 domain-containing protein [Balneolaceae bacterium]